MTKTKRPPLSKEQLVKANNANDAYEAGYRAGLHNTEHKKKEYDLSPELSWPGKSGRSRDALPGPYGRQEADESSEASASLQSRS